MRKCQDCLHYSGEKMIAPIAGGVEVDADWCSKNMFYVRSQGNMLKNFGCDDFWPKSGATCEECRFGELAKEKEVGIICHLTTNPDCDNGYYKYWYCEMWRAKE